MSHTDHRPCLSEEKLILQFRMLQKLKNPEKVAEVKAQVQRLDQQLAADAQQQKRNEFTARLKVRASFPHPSFSSFWSLSGNIDRQN